MSHWKKPVFERTPRGGATGGSAEMGDIVAPG